MFEYYGCLLLAVQTGQAKNKQTDACYFLVKFFWRGMQFCGRFAWLVGTTLMLQLFTVPWGNTWLAHLRLSSDTVAHHISCVDVESVIPSSAAASSPQNDTRGFGLSPP